MLNNNSKLICGVYNKLQQCALLACNKIDNHLGIRYEVRRSQILFKNQNRKISVLGLLTLAGIAVVGTLLVLKSLSLIVFAVAGAALLPLSGVTLVALAILGRNVYKQCCKKLEAR